MMRSSLTHDHCDLFKLATWLKWYLFDRWYEDNEPESIAIPDYENRILEQVSRRMLDRVLPLIALLYRNLP